MNAAAVYLIGAGPGDPSLISVRGLRYLSTADVVVFDRLVLERLLRSVRPDAELIDVGAAAPQSMEQDAISILLADKATEGKRVARLMYGDPFIFDSGGKEALFLYEQGIPFEVVPGVPSMIGGPCYAGVPLTYPEAAMPSSSSGASDRDERAPGRRLADGPGPGEHRRQLRWRPAARGHHQRAAGPRPVAR